MSKTNKFRVKQFEEKNITVEEERKKYSDDAEKLFKREEQAIRVLDNQEEIFTIYSFLYKKW